MSTQRPRAISLDLQESPLETLRRCGGFYECPKSSDGKRLGPLVGYAGKDSDGRNFVGDIYANFAKAEEYPNVLQSFAIRLHQQIPGRLMNDIDVLCGAPLGGMAFAYQLALHSFRRYSFAEKKVLKAAADGQREESVLVFGRHEILEGDEVVIVEDVCNNFSTTEELITLIKKAGGRVRAILSLLNRSTTVKGEYQSNYGGTVPVFSLVTKPIPQYRQGDPEVSADIAAGKIVWKPKAEWDRLMEAMASAQ